MVKFTGRQLGNNMEKEQQIHRSSSHGTVPCYGGQRTILSGRP